MILEVLETPATRPRLISSRPDADLIRETVHGLSWSDITFVILKIDDAMWIEGSGSLNPDDGLSVRYLADGQEYISTRAPKSLDEIVLLLQSFLARDGHWKMMIDWE